MVFKEAAGRDLLQLALIENIQRADLNPIEEAMAYRRLVDEYGLTQEDAARQVGKSRAAVANAMPRRASITSRVRSAFSSVLRSV